MLFCFSLPIYILQIFLYAPVVFSPYLHIYLSVLFIYLITKLIYISTIIFLKQNVGYYSFILYVFNFLDYLCFAIIFFKQTTRNQHTVV